MLRSSEVSMCADSCIAIRNSLRLAKSCPWNWRLR